jgi:hypothetical protein
VLVWAFSYLLFLAFILLLLPLARDTSLSFDIGETIGETITKHRREHIRNVLWR